MSVCWYQWGLMGAYMLSRQHDVMYHIVYHWSCSVLSFELLLAGNFCF